MPLLGIHTISIQQLPDGKHMDINKFSFYDDLILHHPTLKSLAEPMGSPTFFALTDEKLASVKNLIYLCPCAYPKSMITIVNPTLKSSREFI